MARRLISKHGGEVVAGRAVMAFRTVSYSRYKSSPTASAAVAI